MSNPRFNKIAGIFGKRGSGKTEYLRGNKEFGIVGFIAPALQKGQKVLIVDTLDHPSYSDIPIIKIENLLSWKKGCYRIYVPVYQMPQLLEVVSNIWNALIVFEDARKYIKKTIPDPVLKLIGDSKQQNVDIIFMYHSFSHAPKDLYSYLEYIELFKTKFHPKCRMEELGGEYEEAVKAYEEVTASSNPFAHKLIDLDN